MPSFLDQRFAALTPYTPGQQPQKRQYTKLNTNELPFAPSPKVVRAAAREAQWLNRYCDPEATELRRAMAQYFNVEINNCFVCNGSDEVLAFCFQAFCPNGAAFPDLTYGFYPVFAQLYGVNAKVAPLGDDFTLAVKDYVAMNRTLFIANPNAPTGLALSLEELEVLLGANAQNLVVVDEAYVDFGAQSALPLLKTHENLLVVGTFSKSRALAGGRLGYAIGSCKVIADLERIRYSFNPYNVNRLTQAAGAAALEDDAYYKDCQQAIIQTRERTTQKLLDLGFTCTKSKANFIFAVHPGQSGETLAQKLWEQGILVRRWDQARIQNHLRITVGTQREMDALCTALEDILKT